MASSKRGAIALVVMALFISVIGGVTLIWAQEEDSESSAPATNYLYISEFEIGADQSLNEALAECTKWVKIYRETGEFTSVRLFIHHTGPRAALYLLLETDNWQAIEDGHNKWIAAMPDFFDRKMKFGSHSDNLLNEIQVE
jgi:hypothetical protein